MEGYFWYDFVSVTPLKTMSVPYRHCLVSLVQYCCFWTLDVLVLGQMIYFTTLQKLKQDGFLLNNTTAYGAHIV